MNETAVSVHSLTTGFGDFLVAKIGLFGDIIEAKIWRRLSWGVSHDTVHDLHVEHEGRAAIHRV